MLLVDLSMNSLDSLFLLQNAAKSHFPSGSHEPASVKRRRVERTDLKTSLTIVPSPGQGFFVNISINRRPRKRAYVQEAELPIRARMRTVSHTVRTRAPCLYN